MKLELIRKAISSRKQIRFEYSRPGSPAGVRVGNPHAIYVNKRKDGGMSTMVDIFQTSGVSGHPEKLPGWRPFKLEKMESIELLTDEACFILEETYIPTSHRYRFVIEKA
jgi:predicted DNA-binding transcriptional regulator YafY